MGYLDGSTITVDAILTQEGRKKLARGAGLGISKFSLYTIYINLAYKNKKKSLNKKIILKKKPPKLGTKGISQANKEKKKVRKNAFLLLNLYHHFGLEYAL